MNTLDNFTSSIATEILDNVYTTLIDAGLDPGVAYQRAFNSDYDFALDLAENPVSAEEAEDELDAWVPSV